MKGPLSGLRVLDLTSIIMGPYCTQILGDMGADVIKVESIDGDVTRFIGPARHTGMSSTFLHLGRNKRSIVLNLKKEEGKKALFKLVETADIFVHTMRPKAIQKLGISYEEIVTVNNNLIYCGAYGFSKNGPYGDKPAYDDMIQGASGLAAAQTELSGSPQYMGTVMADKTTGLMMLNAILAALYHREKSGEGQNIEVPMFETMSAYTLIEHMYGLTFDPPLDSSFYPRVISKYRKPYQTADGYISVTIHSDKQWSNFFTLSGNTELIHDERFQDIEARTKHTDELYMMIEEIMISKKTREWLNILEKADIPVMPILKPEDLLVDPHLQQINFFEKVNHPSEGDIWNINFPVQFSKTPILIEHFAPRLGEHSKEILCEIGYSEQETIHLFEQGVSFEKLYFKENRIKH
ncbi:CoA transferase [Cytobacillus depressus]|uniref:CoA transferase n=1 Tax=Cytobacillus depressus TaxID=1602942 RepID=A0A6L3VAT8_9BACI|nr:CoA transferase [Cytobacillus depressus]KAB2336218.1 CoA transferase [Cytobacillus depressus]